MTREVSRAVKVSLLLARAMAEAIKGAGSISSGELYATMTQYGVSLETYQSCVGVLKKSGLVKELNHLLTWVGVK